MFGLNPQEIKAGYEHAMAHPYIPPIKGDLFQFIPPNTYLAWLIVSIIISAISHHTNSFRKRTDQYASADYLGAALVRELDETIEAIDRQCFDPSKYVVQGLDGLSGKVDTNGNLIFTHYDDSEHAHASYGNYVASSLIIKAKHKDWFKRRLADGSDHDASDLTDMQALALALEKHTHLARLEEWLRSNALPYEYDFNDWS